ncbi:hypothetical protein IEI94_10090 [Halomonas sp. ML-15]|uniref:hypothetical protein n=1 Tax=Halomonas sp. ML-15 TaxID=2773305 RepID=UPI0017466E29|nr:hypothetical protein [Halomonas sp. ML-15]MBD3896200.1 hypothetical protein [Halomonas sp. ML-15]
MKDTAHEGGEDVVMAEDKALPGLPDERRTEKESPSTWYYYHAYGFDIASQIPLPELVKVTPSASPDIEIVADHVDVTLHEGKHVNQWLQIGKEHCQIWVEGIARYRIEAGRRVVVDRRVSDAKDNAAAASDIRVYLLGTVFGVLAHQCRWLPLHVSAIKAPNGVWAFTGESGAGKSTLSAWLHHHHGCGLVTDDVAVVKPEESLPLLHPGPRKVKLWKQTLAALDIDAQHAQRDLMRVDKYHLALDHQAALGAEPLKALVVLERGNPDEPPKLSEATGAEALYLLLESIYRPEIGRAYQAAEEMMAACQVLTGQIRVYRYRRPWDLDGVSSSLGPLLKEMGFDNF